MSTVGVSHTLQEITPLLIIEVMYYAQDRRGFNGATVVSCFQNVVCVELRMSIIDLPTSLWSIYDEASAHQARVYDSADLARKIQAISENVA